MRPLLRPRLPPSRRSPARRAPSPIAGQADPRFQAALAAWLADDEPAALPELAALAAEGNRAAQVLLALIDRVPAYQGPWLVERRPRGSGWRSPARRAGSPAGAGWRRPPPTRRSPRSGSSATRTDTTVETAARLRRHGRGPRRPRDAAGDRGAPVPRLRGRRRRPALPAGPAPPGLARMGGDARRAAPRPRPRSPPSRRATRRSAASSTARSARPTPTPGSPRAPLAAPLRATCDAVCPASPGHLPARRLPAGRRAAAARRVRHALGDADPARGVDRQPARPEGAPPRPGRPLPLRLRDRGRRARRGRLPRRRARRRGRPLLRADRVRPAGTPAPPR